MKPDPATQDLSNDVDFPLPAVGTVAHKGLASLFLTNCLTRMNSMVAAGGDGVVGRAAGARGCRPGQPLLECDGEAQVRGSWLPGQEPDTGIELRRDTPEIRIGRSVGGAEAARIGQAPTCRDYAGAPEGQDPSISGRKVASARASME
jgi:hypothetical protein